MLQHNDLEVAMVTLKILNCIEVPGNLPSTEALRVAGSLVALFFNVLELIGEIGVFFIY